jgi:hypothetical protein
MLACMEPAWDSNWRVFPGQQPRFMPAHNDCKYASFFPTDGSDRVRFLRSAWRIFGLRSARAAQNSDSDQDDDTDRDPQLRNSNQIGGDGETDDQYNESDQVGTE